MESLCHFLSVGSSPLFPYQNALGHRLKVWSPHCRHAGRMEEEARECRSLAQYSWLARHLSTQLETIDSTKQVLWERQAALLAQSVHLYSQRSSTIGIDGHVKTKTQSDPTSYNHPCLRYRPHTHLPCICRLRHCPACRLSVPLQENRPERCGWVPRGMVSFRVCNVREFFQ